MKPNYFISVVLFFISSMVFCRANLADTEAQCISKYGAESDIRTDLGYGQVGDKAASFNLKTSYGSLAIRITFLGGLSCHESYANADSSVGLSEDQMKAILDAQSAGFQWEKGKKLYRTGGSYTSGTINWLRSDGATAMFWMSGKASSQTLSGQVDLSTKYYTYAQGFYDKKNGGN